MKKYILAAVVVVAIGAYVIWSSHKSSPSASPTPVADTNGTAMPTTGGTQATTSSGTPTPTTTAGVYKDGTYTGSVAPNIYGPIQVSVVISGGKITDVTFLQSPSAPGHTQQVSAMALPALKQEAITAQSAKVNIVSGATQDSQAFQQSLAAALQQAQT